MVNFKLKCESILYIVNFKDSGKFKFNNLQRKAIVCTKYA